MNSGDSATQATQPLPGPSTVAENSTEPSSSPLGPQTTSEARATTEQESESGPRPLADDPPQPSPQHHHVTQSPDVESEAETHDSLAHDSVPNEAAPLIQVDPSSRYAKRAYLSRFIPELDPESERASAAFRVWRSKRSTMLAIQHIMAYVIATANIAVLIWAVRAHPPYRGFGTLFVGNCSTVSFLDTLLHLGLNAVSTLFLGAGNWCLQILVAPSIQEIRAAHRQGKSLDIGVPSLRNLWHIDRVRVCIWAGIGLTSSILHLMYVEFAQACPPYC